MEAYRVVLELVGGTRMTYLVTAGGPSSAELRARGKLGREVPAEAFTATVVSVTPAPEEEGT